MGDDSVTVEEVDGLLCVGGNTYEYREQLKRLGLRWNSKSRVWTTPNRTEGMINSLKRSIGPSLVVIHSEIRPEPRRPREPRVQEERYRPAKPVPQLEPSHIRFASTSPKRNQPPSLKSRLATTAPKGKAPRRTRANGAALMVNEGFRLRLEDSDEDEDDYPAQKRQAVNYKPSQGNRRSYSLSPSPSPPMKTRRAPQRPQQKQPPKVRGAEREDSYEEVYIGHQTNIRLEVVSPNDDEVVSNFW